LPVEFSHSLAGKVGRIPDLNVPKMHLGNTLSCGHLDRILCGRASLTLHGQRVTAVAVRLATDDEVSLETRLVVVAAGCASKGMVEGLVGRTPWTEEIKHRRVHMTCVRTPRGFLPVVSLAAPLFRLVLAAHEQADNVTWYVTPLEPDAESHDDVPHDADSDVDRESSGHRRPARYRQVRDGRGNDQRPPRASLQKRRRLAQR